MADEHYKLDHVCPYITYCYSRREQWRGHDSKKQVRASIRASGANGLRIFARMPDGAYHEVPRSNWDWAFKD